MQYFAPVFLLSIFSVSFEGLVYIGTLGKAVGTTITYVEISLIVALLLLGRREFAAVVYLTFLGSALTEIDFLQDQGFITSSAFLTHPGFLAMRVPGLPIGWSTLLGLFILVAAFHRQKMDNLFRAKLRIFGLFLAFGASALAFSVLSYLGDTFSGDVFAKDLNRFLISAFAFGPLFLNFTKKDAIGTLLGLTVGTLLTTSALFHLGVTRIYAGSSVALSVPSHAYIFLIAILVPGIGWLARTLIFFLVLGLAFESSFLMSGKTAVSLLLLGVLVSGQAFGRRLTLGLRFLVLLLILAPILLLDFTSIGTFFINHGYELAGYKIRQLDFLHNFSELGATIFFHSSGGNLVAETVTVGAMLLGMIPEHLPLVGLGFGGQLVDHFHILALSNADSYPADAFQSGRFAGMHLAFLSYLFWGGIVGIAFVWTITVRYILPNKEVWLTWAMFMSFWILGLSDKFDATLFALLLSTVFADSTGRWHQPAWPGERA